MANVRKERKIVAMLEISDPTEKRSAIFFKLLYGNLTKAIGL